MIARESMRPLESIMPAMARWELTIELDRRKRVPLYLQIARAISENVRRGRLHPGDLLPGTPTLARSLDVQRMTVVAAFDELLAEGWIETHPARGTIVSPELPDLRSPRAGSDGVPRHAPFEIPPAPPAEMPYDVPRGGSLFAPNRPDVRLVPRDLIGRAYRRALHDAGHALLGYGRPQGHERLRKAVAAMLASTRGIAATADDICITRGSQMAVALLGRALLRPGDIVAVEELTYRPAVEVFRSLGAKVVPIPLDNEGARVESIEELAGEGHLRAVHLTPHLQEDRSARSAIRALFPPYIP